MSERLEVESGLAVFARLAKRPKLSAWLGPNLPLPALPLVLHCPLSILSPYSLELAARAVLPREGPRGVHLGGAAAELVIVNANHTFSMGSLVNLLASRVRAAAAQHLATLPRQDRARLRLTSSMQWDIVRQAADRCHVLEPFTPLELELSFLSLKRVVQENINVAAVLVLGINAFFHQVRHESGTSQDAYIKKMRGYLESALGDLKDDVKAVIYQHNLFKESKEKSQDCIILEETEEIGQWKVIWDTKQIQFKTGASNEVLWLDSYCG